MRKASAIFDFNKLNCVIMVDDEVEGVDEEPRKFIIRVEGCKREFLFKAKSPYELKEWLGALYANWEAGNGVNV